MAAQLLPMLTLILSGSCAEALVPSSAQAVQSQNQCVLRHMLLTYISDDQITVANVAKLFDAVTVNYHKQGRPQHNSLLSSYQAVPDDNSQAMLSPGDEELSSPPSPKKKRGLHATIELTANKTVTADVCEHQLETSLHECLPGSTILSQRGYDPNSTDTVSGEEFSHLCPALLFQMTMTPCMYHPHSFLAEQTPAPPVSATNVMPYLAWGGALGSVLIISLVGLAVISIIPCLKNNIYKVAIQYLVALAVGTLVGDALLHLLPHALSEHKDIETDLRSSHHHVWRATVSLAGIFIFFNAERILGVITSKKQKKSSKMADGASNNNHREISAAVHDEEDGESQLGSCDSCADVSIVIGHSNRDMDGVICDAAAGADGSELKKMVNQAHKELHTNNRIPCHHSKDLVGKQSACRSCHQDAKPALRGDFAYFPTSGLKRASLPALGIHGTGTAAVNSDRRFDASSEETRPMLSHHLETIPSSPTTPVKTVCSSKATDRPVKDVRDTPADEEAGGAHQHGHSHEVPESCSSVAYMVIVGDGLHNFTDGLAIGAAFAASFTGGLSTAIAVLCHELPHELGDFAMLLKSGMTVKQAYLCNILSACLQCLGVIIGVLMGNVESASQYLFALAGGIFLYVGLVDMLPEITKVDHERVGKQLVLQNLGLLTGFGLMFVIAVYETDIESLFSVEAHSD